MGSSEYGLSHSLKGDQSSNSKFTHLLIMDLPNLIPLLLDNVRQVNCLLKVFLVKNLFFTLMAATCHEAISINFLRTKCCLFFIVVSNERETWCVNFELDLHVLLRL